MSQQNDEENTGRVMSTAEKLIAQQLDKERQKEIAIENLEEYRKALNGVAATPNGQLVFKTFIKAFGVFAVRPSRTDVALVEHKALREFYLTLIRPHLDTDLRQTLEN